MPNMELIQDTTPADTKIASTEAKDATQNSPSLSVKADVKQWQERIRRAKAKWEPDFNRMKENMAFLSGLQWNAQTKIDDDRYIANFTLRSINQKVATLYARNPTVVAVPRKRLNFEIWDGKMESLMDALGQAMQGVQMGMVPPQAMALLNDFQRGRLMEEVVRRIGETLERVFQYQMDAQEPDFKMQAKQAVRRACVCGVGYFKVIFCRNYETNDLTQSETRQSIAERMLRVKLIAEKIADGKVDENDAQLETLRELISSLSLSPLDQEEVKISEHLIFDFPPATAIIPDDRCRNLRGFVGAHWLAEEYIYPLDYVNAMFETDIKPGGDLKHYTGEGKPQERNEADSAKDDPSRKPMVLLWQIWDLDTKSTFVICDGYNDYVMAPETMTPATKSFWVHFPLTFNDIETEPGCKSSIFPPSDVQLLKPMQKELNRSHQALRQIRRANSPKYGVVAGKLTEQDKMRLQDAEDNEVIEFQGVIQGEDISKVITPLNLARVDPLLYDNKPIMEDALLATGQQEANVGPAPANVTATVGSIAEQSRQTVATSNIDDLDDCLSAVARCGGEMLFREMSVEVVKRIAGIGAVWPEQQKEEFLNQVELTVLAASSGRPNKAVEIANFERVAPMLLQAGANPQAIIREAVKRLDDRLEPADFFPLPGMLPTAQPGMGGAQRPQQANEQGQQQMNPAPPPVPPVPQ